MCRCKMLAHRSSLQERGEERWRDGDGSPPDVCRPLVDVLLRFVGEGWERQHPPCRLARTCWLPVGDQGLRDGSSCDCIGRRTLVYITWNDGRAFIGIAKVRAQDESLPRVRV